MKMHFTDAVQIRVGEVIDMVSEAFRPIIYFRYVLKSGFTYQSMKSLGRQTSP